MDPFTVAATLGLLAVGCLAGFASARYERHKPICTGCQHGLSYHDPDGDECHAKVRWPAPNDHYEQCTCWHYVGPIPPAYKPPTSRFQPRVIDDHG